MDREEEERETERDRQLLLFQTLCWDFMYFMDFIDCFIEQWTIRGFP